MITVYRTGKYITTGSTSEKEAHQIKDRFLALLTDMEAVEPDTDKKYQIQNYVCTAELGHTLNLNALAIGLGLENTEYEPEQFPGLIYRHPDLPCVILLFASGRIVITGSPSLEVAEKAHQKITEKIEELLEI